MRLPRIAFALGIASCAPLACTSGSSSQDSTDSGSPERGDATADAPASDATEQDSQIDSGAPSDAGASDGTIPSDAGATDGAKPGDGGAESGPACAGIDVSFGDAGLASWSSPPAPGLQVPGVVVVQTDGKIVAVGPASITTTVALARFNADGSPDTGFGTNGVATFPQKVTVLFLSGLAIQSDGKLLVTGYTVTVGPTVQFTPLLMRVDTAGALDPTFGTGGYASSPPSAKQYDMALVRPDDSIAVVGLTISGTDALVAEYDKDGALVSTFGNGGLATTAAPPGGTVENTLGVIDPSSGDVVLAASQLAQTDGGRQASIGVTRFSSADAGVSTTTVPVGGYAVLAGIARQSTGAVVIAFGEQAGTNNAFNLLRLTSSGQPDQGFGAGGIVTTSFFGGQDMPAGLTVLPGDALFVTGTVTLDNDANGPTALGAALYSASGALDPSFGKGGLLTAPVAAQQFPNFAAQALAPSGLVVVAGIGAVTPPDGGSAAAFLDVERLCP